MSNDVLTASVFVQKLLDAWYPLWTLVFQPALGVLMLGAVSFSSPVAVLHLFCVVSDSLHSLFDMLSGKSHSHQTLRVAIMSVGAGKSHAIGIGSLAHALLCFSCLLMTAWQFHTKCCTSAVLHLPCGMPSPQQ